MAAWSGKFLLIFIHSYIHTFSGLISNVTLEIIIRTSSNIKYKNYDKIRTSGIFKRIVFAANPGNNILFVI